MLLGSEEGLADSVVSGNRSYGELNFRSGLRGFFVPWVLGKKSTPEAARECELQGIGLADFEAIKRTGHGIEEIRQKDSIKPVPLIRRQHKIKCFCVNGPQESGQGIGCNSSRFG